MKLWTRRLIAFVLGGLLLATPVLAQQTPEFSKMAENDNVAAVQKYLAGGGSPNATEGARNLTLLHWAAFHGSIDTVKLLVEKGARIDVPAKGTIDWVPLHYAAARGHLDVVRYLLDRDANIGTLTQNGMSPLAAAALNKQPEVIKYLVGRNADGGQALVHAVKLNNVRALRLLLESGIKAQAAPRTDVPKFGYSMEIPAFFVAVDEGKASLVTLFLEFGADPNWEFGYHQSTALNFAIGKCDGPMIDALIAKGASVRPEHAEAAQMRLTYREPCPPQIVDKLRRSASEI